MSKKTFKEGEVVFAKVKGYPPWPAQVIAAAKGKYPVLFYGTNESANCKPQDLFQFADFEEKYGKNSKPAFLKAMSEARDAIAGVSNSNSGGTRSRRSETKSSANQKAAVSANQVEESESEEEPPKKRTKAVSKANKKTPATKAAKKAPASRKSSRKTVKNDDESEEEVDEAESPQRGGSRRGGSTRLSDDRKEGKSGVESDAASAASQQSESASSERDSDADSVEAAPVKKTRAKAVSRKSPVKRGRTAKKVDSSEDEKEAEKSEDSVSDAESAKSSSSSESHSSSSSSSKSGSSESSQPSTEKDRGDEAKLPAGVEKGNNDEGELPTPAGVEKGEDKKGESNKSNSDNTAPGALGGDGESVTTESKEVVTSLPGESKDDSDNQNASATNSSAEDDDVIHSSRAHKSHSKNAVLSESDSEEETKPKEEEKDLEQLLAERKQEHQELKLKRRQEKLEERRQRQLQREKEQEEERKAKEEKKRQHHMRLKTEKKLRELDDVIKRSLAVSTKDVDKCLEAMKELNGLEIIASMLVKYPTIIDTLKKCRKYKADVKVMSQADSLCNKLKSIASSDKSALSALNKQKSDKQKEKKPSSGEKVVTQTSSGEHSVSVPPPVTEPVGAETGDTILEPSVGGNNTVAETNEVGTDDVQPMKSEENVVTEPIREPAEDDMAIDDRSEQVLSNIQTASVNTHAENIENDSDKVNTDNKTDHTDSPLIQSADNTEETSQSQEATHANQPVVGSVSDLKVMVKDELPSEDVLTAGIQALIAKTQESTAILDQVIKQKKDKRSSSSSSRKRRKIDSGLHQYESSRSSSAPHKPLPSSKSTAVATSLSSTKSVDRPTHTSKKVAELDDMDIHDLLGI